MAEHKQYRYPGLKPFSVKESSIFFGRGSDIKELEKSIKLDKQLVLYSKSGLGKSSLLNAGLTPRLQKQKNVIPFRVRFSAYRKGDSLGLLETVRNRLWQEVAEKADMAGIEAASDTLWYQFKQAQNGIKGQPTFILIFDQFEEAFTYPQRELNQFKRQLANLLNNSMPKAFLDALGKQVKGISDDQLRALYEPLKVKAIYAIRSDKISLMDDLKDVLPDILSRTYRLLALNRDQAEDAILNPAYQKGEEFISPRFDFKDEALDAILDYLTKGNEQQVESFQLQIICQYVENIVVEQGKTLIERADLGEITDIFENYYDSLIRRISSPDDRKRARTFIEEGLILEADEIRLSLHEGQIERDYGITPELLEQLEETRLIRGEPSPRGGQIYELSHDTLIKPILRAKERRRLEEAFSLEEAERAEREEARQALNQRQQRRVFMGAAGLIILIFLANAGFSYYQNSQNNELTIAKLDRQRDSLRIVVDSLLAKGATREEIQQQLSTPVQPHGSSDPKIAEWVDNLYEYQDQTNNSIYQESLKNLREYDNDEVLVRDILIAARAENRYRINKDCTWQLVSLLEEVDPDILRKELNSVSEYIKLIEPNVGSGTKSRIQNIRRMIKSRQSAPKPPPANPPSEDGANAPVETDSVSVSGEPVPEEDTELI